MLHPRLLLVLAYVSTEFVTTGSIRTATWKKVVGPNPGIAAIEAGRRARVQCAMACLHRKGRCHGFTYSESTGMCLLGHSVASTFRYSLHAPDGTLYASTVCDLDSGFGIYSRANVSTCLWISTGKATFDTADQLCHSKGGNLVTLQTPEKFDIFWDLARAIKEWMWVGLDDRDVEDEFRWHDDNSLMTSAQRQAYFPADQPSNTNNEDCVHSGDPGLFNDISCNQRFRYICETEPVSN